MQYCTTSSFFTQTSSVLVLECTGMCVSEYGSIQLDPAPPSEPSLTSTSKKENSPYGTFNPLHEIIFPTDNKTISLLSVFAWAEAGAKGVAHSQCAWMSL